MRIQLLALLGLSLVACRGDEGDDAPPADAAPKIKVKDIQNASMPVNTEVVLENVVVTAVDKFGARTGEIWVQDLEGGEFSGVKVFNGPVAVTATLEPGDIVTIAGAKKDEFALSSDMSGRKTTELVPVATGSMTITKTGSGAVPAPVVVDAVAIGKMPQAQQDTEWEKWEGVLITVSKVTQLTFVTSFGSTVPTPDDSFKFDVDGGLVIESTQFKFDAAYDINVCYSTVTGVADYFFDYLLLPRKASDLGAPTTGCDAAKIPEATITQVQGGMTGNVVMKDVYVTGLGFGRKTFWVSASLTAAPNEGVYVFRSSSAAALPADVVVGAKISVSGTITEFNDDTNGGALTEITGPGWRVQPGAPGTVVPVTGMTATQLLVPATAPMYESVLVTLTDVEITAIGNAANGFIASATQAGEDFGASTEALRLVAADVKCYESITGYWTNLQAPGSGATTKPNAFGFVPLTLGATGTNCN